MPRASPIALAAAAAALLAAPLASAAPLSETAGDWLLQRAFRDFQDKFGKAYPTELETQARLAKFTASVERVARLNAEMETDIYGITKFSDMSPTEFADGYLNYKPRGAPAALELHSRNVRQATPSSYDWRTKGKVTDVKDQGGCGSCWAHSVTETIESAWAIDGNRLEEFSVQQIVSCDSKDAGCRGGDIPSGMDYVESAGGLASADSYPYTSGSFPWTSGSCKAFTVAGGTISGYTYATTPCYGTCASQDEDTLAANVASTQPAGICVDASTWQDYSGGVVTTTNNRCSSTYSSLDHCVQLVGYENKGSSNAYWLVRNSWGEDWGEDGYIYLAMGTNTCGVADEAIFATIA